MRVIEEPFPEHISEGSVVTIGKYDGVHIGHRAVLGATARRATELGLESIVVTFHRNPHEVVRPYSAPQRILSLAGRLERIAQTGIDTAVVIRFDEARSEETAEDFVRELLVGRLAARVITVGSDFRFGRRGDGDVALLRELGPRYGFEVVEFDLVGTVGEAKVSSTRIRELVLEGDVAHAGELLGAPVSVTGVVVHGSARGRELGVPTANLELGEFDLVPADGVYAGWAVVDGARYAAAISVSDNPTFDDVPDRRVEAHLLDVALDLYGHRITVEFVARLRGIERFDGVEALMAAMQDDLTQTRAVLEH
ncbi:MAG TPA: bifunctional riboflavin kinase/FAD synthetase [Microbacteriaceae bacterium]|nr:bifunctional riboflavin kinase/FAD synthetase [Microbacteriaceae bacterium]